MFRLSFVVLVVLTSSSYAQSFNLDLQGSINSQLVPLDSYGAAAGSPGRWNAVDAPFDVARALVDLAGNPTPVTVVCDLDTPPFSSNNALTSGDDERLLDDAQCTFGFSVKWTFTGLESGRYEVFVYAWDPQFINATMSNCVDGDTTSCATSGGGAFPGTHAEGLTYTRHVTDVTNGELDVRSSSTDPVLKAFSALNGIQLLRLGSPAGYCHGDGGVAPGCTPCPCGNDAPAGTPGGCLDSAGTSPLLEVSGIASVANDTLRVEASGLPTSTVGLLFSGTTQLPGNPMHPCFGLNSGIANVGDGLRCIGGNQRRHGTRPSDANGAIGVTTGGWGPPSPPSGGLVTSSGFTAGETRYLQVFFRELVTAGCMSGVGTTQGVRVVIVP